MAKESLAYTVDIGGKVAAAPRGMTFKLAVVEGPDEGLEVPLDGTVEIGADSSCALRLADRAASRRHASVAVGREANGLLFVADREARQIDVVDVATERLVSVVPLDVAPDYVRWSPTTNEVWVTEPAESRIEVLTFAHAGSPSLAKTGAFIHVDNGPEGLVFDGAGRAYVHHYAPSIGAIDVRARVQVERWSTGCGASHGIPIVDATSGLVFAGCRETAKVVVLSTRTGEKVAESAIAGGTSVLAYSESLGHFYLRADPGSAIAVFGVAPSGALSPLGELRASEEGHVMAADDRGGLWVADPASARLLRLADPFASSR